jgi:hypothetical protein
LAIAAAQVIAFVCVLVWLINYHHFLTWRWRGFKKLADPFFVPDPSTIHVDLGPMVSRSDCLRMLYVLQEHTAEKPPLATALC